MNKNDQRYAEWFWGQEQSSFNKDNVKSLVGWPILMMVKLVLLLEATISEAAHSVLKAVIIVICPFRSSKESTQNSWGEGRLGGSLQSAYFSPASLITSMPWLWGSYELRAPRLTTSRIKSYDLVLTPCFNYYLWNQFHFHLYCQFLVFICLTWPSNLNTANRQESVFQLVAWIFCSLPEVKLLQMQVQSSRCSV